MLKSLLAPRYERRSRYPRGSSARLYAERGETDAAPVEQAYGEELEDGVLVFLALSAVAKLQYCTYLTLDRTGRDHCCEQAQIYG